MFTESDIKRLVRKRLQAAGVWGRVDSVKVERRGFRKAKTWLVTVLVGPGCDPRGVFTALSASEFDRVLLDGSYVSGYYRK